MSMLTRWRASLPVLRSSFTSADVAVWAVLLVLGSLAGWLVVQLPPLPMALVGLALLGALGFVVLTRNPQRLRYAMFILMLAATISREQWRLPIETDLIGFTLLFVWLFLTAPKAFLNRRAYPVLPLIFVFLLLNVAAAYFNSPVARASLRQTFVLGYRAVTFYLVIIVMLQYPGWRSRFPRYFQGIMIFQVLCSIVAIPLYSFQRTPFVQPKPGGGLSIVGFFQESNITGIFILCILALTLSQWVFNRRTGRFIITLLVGFVGLLLSYTRSAWLGFGLVLAGLGLFLFARSNWRVKRAYLRTLLALLVLLTLAIGGILVFSALVHPLPLAGRLLEVVDTSGHSVTGRFDRWQDALSLWNQHPWIGAGFLSYQAVSTSGSGWLFNFLLQSLHDSGGLGTVILLLIYLSLMLYPWRAYTLADNPDDKAILLGYLLAQIALYFTALFSAYTWSSFAWVLLGLSTGHSLIILHGSDGRARREVEA